MPMTVEEILARAKEARASDVHITVGIPPKMRVNGDLLTMEGDRLMPADTLENERFSSCSTCERASSEISPLSVIPFSRYSEPRLLVRIRIVFL